VKDYTKAFLEQNFSHTSCALLMDEAEGDKEGVMSRLWNLILLLSDHGATGGRGSSSGQSRTIDLHSSVTMVATLTDLGSGRSAPASPCLSWKDWRAGPTGPPRPRRP
jgi:hypothetical protein